MNVAGWGARWRQWLLVMGASVVARARGPGVGAGSRGWFSAQASCQFMAPGGHGKVGSATFEREDVLRC